jgi:hypothetical protein
LNKIEDMNQILKGKAGKSEEEKKVEDVLAITRRQYEKEGTNDFREIIISALKRVVIECGRIFVSTSELKKAGFMTKKYGDEIARLTGQGGAVIKQRTGQTDIYYLREILDNMSNKFSEN